MKFKFMKIALPWYLLSAPLNNTVSWSNQSHLSKNQNENLVIYTRPGDLKWSEWTDCSAACGRGMRRRHTMCALTKNGQLKTCKEYGLKEQAYEHIDNCNTWNRATCSEWVPKLMAARKNVCWLDLAIALQFTWPSLDPISLSPIETIRIASFLLCSDCSPCIGYNCMEFASCSDVSTDQDPITECVCQLGRVKSGDGQECVIPPPSTPTPRPIPTLQV